MRNYFIFFVFLLLFSGCSQKNIGHFESLNELSSSGQSLERHQDIQNLHNKLEELLSVYLAEGRIKKKVINSDSRPPKIQGNNSIIGKISFAERYNFEENLFLSHSKDRKVQGRNKLLKKDDKVKIKSNSYQTINSKNELTNLKNTMTYILFPRNLIGQNKKSKKYQRYAKVLELIQEFKRVNNATSLTKIKTYENKFILPKIKSVNEDKVTVETYNYKLSNKILDFFKEKITPLFFDKDGPFFITVAKNVFNQEKVSSFIYLDLSTFNESAINQVINSYKHRLVEKGNANIGTLEEWHYNILSAITNFNDNLHLFQVVVAGEE